MPRSVIGGAEGGVAGPGMFSATEEDFDGIPEIARGKKQANGSRRKLLLVGKGDKAGQARRDDIYASFTVGKMGNRTSQYFWGPPGAEERTRYEDIEVWMKGFWKNQFPEHSHNLLRGARAGRLYSILTGAETIERAMISRFNPSSDTHPRNGGARKRKLDAVIGEEPKDGAESTQQDDSSVGASRSRKNEHTTTTAESLEAAGQDTDESYTTSDSPENASDPEQQDNLSATTIIKEEDDDQGAIKFVNCTFGEHVDRQMLLIGFGIQTIGGEERSEAIFACPTHGGRSITFGWGPRSFVTKASYGDVTNWCRGLWCWQVTLGEVNQERARNMRIHNLFNGVEKIEDALDSRVSMGSLELNDLTTQDANDTLNRLHTASSRFSAGVDRDISSTLDLAERGTSKSSQTSKAVSGSDKHYPRESLFKTTSVVSTQVSVTPAAVTRPSIAATRPATTPAAENMPRSKIVDVYDSQRSASVSAHAPFVPLHDSSLSLTQPLAARPQSTPRVTPATTLDLSCSAVPESSVTTTDDVNELPTTTRREAINIYFEAQQTRCRPEILQQAMSIILTRTPPLHLVQTAVLWASMGKETRAFNDCPSYAKWIKANDVDMKEDMHEDVY